MVAKAPEAVASAGSALATTSVKAAFALYALGLGGARLFNHTTVPAVLNPDLDLVDKPFFSFEASFGLSDLLQNPNVSSIKEPLLLAGSGGPGSDPIPSGIFHALHNIPAPITAQVALDAIVALAVIALVYYVLAKCVDLIIGCVLELYTKLGTVFAGAFSVFFNRKEEVHLSLKKAVEKRYAGEKVKFELADDNAEENPQDSQEFENLTSSTKNDVWQIPGWIKFSASAVAFLAFVFISFRDFPVDSVEVLRTVDSILEKASDYVNEATPFIGIPGLLFEFLRLIFKSLMLLLVSSTFYFQTTMNYIFYTLLGCVGSLVMSEVSKLRIENKWWASRRMGRLWESYARPSLSFPYSIICYLLKGIALAFLLYMAMIFAGSLHPIVGHYISSTRTVVQSIQEVLESSPPITAHE